MKTLIIALVIGVIVASCNAVFSDGSVNRAKILNRGAYDEAKRYRTTKYTKSKKYTTDSGLYCMDIHFMTLSRGRVYQTLCYMGDSSYEVTSSFSTR